MKKCEHETEFSNPCSNCGYDEGVCVKCGEAVFGLGGKLISGSDLVEGPSRKTYMIVVTEVLSSNLSEKQARKLTRQYNKSNELEGFGYRDNPKAIVEVER